MMSLARLGMFNIGCWLLAAYHLFRKNVVCPLFCPVLSVPDCLTGGTAAAGLQE